MRLAFVTNSVSQRQESMEDVELYLVNLNANLESTSRPAESVPGALRTTKPLNCIWNGRTTTATCFSRSTRDRWNGNTKIRSHGFTG